MKLTLSILFIVSFPLTFGLAVSYFIALYNYKKMLILEAPSIWDAELLKSRTLHSWASIAYKIFRTSKNGSFDDHQSSEDLKCAYKKVKILLRSATYCFFMLIITGLSLDLIP